MMKQSATRDFHEVMREVNELLHWELGPRLIRYGVSSAQWWALRVLWVEDGLAPPEIARRAGVASRQIGAALERLISRGMAVRGKQRADRQESAIFLTEYGRRMEAVCLREANAVNAMSLAGLSADDLDACLRLLNRVKGNLQTRVTGVTAKGKSSSRPAARRKPAGKRRPRDCRRGTAAV